MKKLMLVLSPVLALSFVAAAFTAPTATAQPAPSGLPAALAQITSPTALRDEPKCSWPELEGMLVRSAKGTIRLERADVTVEEIPEGSPVTLDFHELRVRVFYSTAGLVVGTPQCG
ncbi:serine protease inhibitor [Streptomyces sp. NBC_00237]|uniref:serine protease inhibitor n=1 Tax=Streptomyces sp. NBC_00237 TaxID=2975687 RepID=UPI002254DDB5|nr:serine protease inhibitor [Streptomyces sp. NBC_00237]MCX5206117.1 serine protease inhibitor [Streptomyces sp. NBC_00237]